MLSVFSKTLLKEIDEKFDPLKNPCFHGSCYGLSLDNICWLISQAEKYQNLKEQNEEYQES